MTAVKWSASFGLTFEAVERLKLGRIAAFAFQMNERRLRHYAAHLPMSAVQGDNHLDARTSDLNIEGAIVTGGAAERLERPLSGHFFPVRGSG